MEQRETKISIENVYKIFGPDPKSVLPLIDQGLGKQEILEQHGHVVGIKDVSLDIKVGETFVVMGLSGSGKSTLIRHINRLIEPTAGRILVDGEDVLQLDAARLLDLRRRRISMVFQRFALLPHKTVLDNVTYGLEIQGVDRKQAHERAMEQIELVGLAGFEKQYPRQLSGGMQQRVGLARALATNAEILLMDEAFSALDPLIRSDMQVQLRELQARLHKTIVFITHDLDEALRLGDHIAILKDGELRQVGTPEQILLHPADDYVERFVRDVNRGRVVTVANIVEDFPTVRLDELSPETVRAQFKGGGGTLFVIDAEGRPLGAIRPETLAAAGDRPAGWWRDADNLETVESVSDGTVIEEVLPLVGEADAPVPVVDDDGRFLGAVSHRGALQALARPSDDDAGNAARAGDGAGASGGGDADAGGAGGDAERDETRAKAQAG